MQQVGAEEELNRQKHHQKVLFCNNESQGKRGGKYKIQNRAGGS